MLEWMTRLLSKKVKQPLKPVRFYMVRRFEPTMHGLTGKRETSKKLIIDYGADWVEVHNWGSGGNPRRCQTAPLMDIIRGDKYRELILMVRGD